MQNILAVYKPICVTPLQVIDKLRLQFPEYKDKKIGYAGRLDPLAHGVLLLMIGEETKQREKYLDLPKEYEFEALFGLQTDSYDVLGLLSKEKFHMKDNFLNTNTIKKFMSEKIGNHLQPYPPFSSKAIGGKPLHWWAKQGRLSEITIPKRKITIYNFELLSTGTITTKNLQEKVIENVNNVQGHFRQKEILEAWKAFLNQVPSDTWQTARFRISCSSGTYVRGLVHELGEKLETGAITTEILRTQIGEHTLQKSVKLSF